jgi:hypothetical protein
MNVIDLKISRKMQKLIKKTEELVRKEIGDKVGVTLVLHPYRHTPEDTPLVAEFQYVSTMPRHHMYGAFRAITDKWDKEGSALKDIPPHMR